MARARRGKRRRGDSGPGTTGLSNARQEQERALGADREPVSQPGRIVDRDRLHAILPEPTMRPICQPRAIQIAVSGLTLPGYPIGGTLTECDPFGIPSTSHWTGAAIIVRYP